MTTGRRPPGYMTEDLELKVTGGPVRYQSDTDKPVEYMALAKTDGYTTIGYIYANDEDNAAGWCARTDAGPEAFDLATPWVLMLLDAAKRGLKPTAALAEMVQKPQPRTHVVAGSRARADSLDALKALAAAP